MPELTQANRDARRTRVGASEVGALLDWHPYTSPGRIYDRIVNEHGVDQTQTMRVGSMLEGPTAKAWGLLNGKKVRANRRTFVSPVTDWLAATPDYFVVGERAVLEVKMTGDRWDDLPSWVAWQIRAQLHITDREIGYACVLNGSQMRTFEIVRDEIAEAEMIAAVAVFGEMNLRPHHPPALEADAARDVLLRVWTPAPGTISADSECEQWARAVLDLQEVNRIMGPLADRARTGLVARLVAADATVMVGRGWRATLEGNPPSRLVVRA